MNLYRVFRGVLYAFRWKSLNCCSCYKGAPAVVGCSENFLVGVNYAGPLNMCPVTVRQRKLISAISCTAVRIGFRAANLLLRPNFKRIFRRLSTPTWTLVAQNKLLTCSVSARNESHRFLSASRTIALWCSADTFDLLPWRSGSFRKPILLYLAQIRSTVRFEVVISKLRCKRATVSFALMPGFRRLTTIRFLWIC